MESKYISLVVGETYKLPISQGARASFLTANGNLLQIGLHNISEIEMAALSKAPLIGLYVDFPVVLFLFDFGFGLKLDSPFDVNLYSKGQLTLPSITNEKTRLSVEAHIVDTASLEIKALRLFTLCPELTLEFLSIVQEQISRPYSPFTYAEKLNYIYSNFTVDTLIKKTKMYSKY